eukprot:Hpha_TRINITY_DN14592_c0_g1::TRINITY_DN14592_c0_g1_i1::g.46658::m.46658
MKRGMGGEQGLKQQQRCPKMGAGGVGGANNVKNRKEKGKVPRGWKTPPLPHPPKCPGLCVIPTTPDPVGGQSFGGCKKQKKNGVVTMCNVCPSHKAGKKDNTTQSARLFHLCSSLLTNSL